jgi:hypothetical protein
VGCTDPGVAAAGNSQARVNAQPYDSQTVVQRFVKEPTFDQWKQRVRGRGYHLLSIGWVLEPGEQSRLLLSTQRRHVLQHKTAALASWEFKWRL